MVALQHDPFGLDVWRLISGMGLGLEMVTIGAYLSEMAPKGMRGKAFACVASGGQSGSALAQRYRDPSATSRTFAMPVA